MWGPSGEGGWAIAIGAAAHPAMAVAAIRAGARRFISLTFLGPFVRESGRGEVIPDMGSIPSFK